jgi:Trk K+ transport system NAD-binding subunit
LGLEKDGTLIVASARDIGNMAAGYMAAQYHIPLGIARAYGFDALETKQKNNYSNFKLFLHYSVFKQINIEGKRTQAGQFFGYSKINE